MSSMCRRFHGEPVMRLIVSVPTDTVKQVDQHMKAPEGHAARRCRSEFVRLAIAEKLERESSARSQGPPALDDFCRLPRARARR